MGYEYGSHSVVIHTLDTVTAVKLGGISAMGMQLGTEISQDDNGQIYDSFASVNLQAPTPRFTTRSIAAALSAIPQTGICINADGSHAGVKLYGEAKGDCQSGDPASGDHLSYLVDIGLITPMQLTGSRRESMRLSVEMDAITDGTNAPFAYDYTETLPTALNIDEYQLAKITLGNILWDDGRNFSLDFGVDRLEKEAQLGGIWPDRAGKRKARPKLTVTGRDPRKLDDATKIPFVGKAGIHADTSVYFRKKKNQAALEPLASTVHIKMTMSGIVYFDNPFEASGPAPAESTVMVNGLFDGANAPLVFTFGVAIPA